MRRSLLALALSLAGVLAGGEAWAQFGPGGGGMRPMGPGSPTGQQQGQGDQKEEGPAEAAPDTQGQEPATQPLPAWPGQREKSLQFFQLNGYLRGRSYLFHNFNLGIPQSTAGPNPPFFVPYSEFNATGNNGTGPASSCAQRNKENCKTENMTSADMRLRLEPTINVGEHVRVKAQVDLLDNMVLGSTPEGYFLNGVAAARDTPLQAFSRSQTTPESGRNSFEDSIRVKRAWAEVRTPIGELRFGRMPSHWGTGMFINNGDCLDCDYGTNVDRVMFVTKEPWKGHFFALLWDWAATGPTTRVYTPNWSSGPAYNADPLDDVSQWGIALGKQDRPDEVREKVERGELVLNYGAYVIYRRQDWDLTTNPGQNVPGGASLGTTPNGLQSQLNPRDAWAIIPDLWLRIAYRKLSVEAEAVLIGGRINQASDLKSDITNGYEVLQWGAVARVGYKLLRDALHIGLEVGTASGDAYEDPTARVNFRTAQYIYPDNARIGRFNFDPDYHVDLILFRRILGTVSNATYFKPTVAYDITDTLTARADVIYSVANNAVGYPGNAQNLGIEVDASVMYHNDEEGFMAGIAYGVLFPLGALSLPNAIYSELYSKDAESAQTLQARLVVKF